MKNDKFKLSILQTTVLGELAKSELKDDYYWTGGTAMANFYLKHRLSFDIDLFSDNPVNYPNVKKFTQNVSKTLKLDTIRESKIFDRWEFILTNGQETRLDFVFYDFKSLKPKVIWNGIKVDSFEDMVANKTMALIDRNDPKDAYDIYFILTKYQLTANRLLELTKQKFESEFTATLFWSKCLLGAKNFSIISPLVIGDEASIFSKIIDYFERRSADSIKILL